MPVRAVIFDLWDTLVDWPVEAMAALNARWAALLGLSTPELERRWRVPQNSLRPLADGLRSLGAADGVVDELVALRHEHARTTLVPRPGAVETLIELGGRGLGRGLISACTGDVPDVWAETPLAPHLDSVVFSATAGVNKPDPRIYELGCAELGVAPAEALFVGDGANDELAGAERAGLRAVLIHRAGREPIWPGLGDWTGPRITAVPELLELL